MEQTNNPFVPPGVSELPWRDRREGLIYAENSELVAEVVPADGDDDHIFPTNAAYIAHAANTLPEALGLLEGLARGFFVDERDDDRAVLLSARLADARATEHEVTSGMIRAARALLSRCRDAGEAKP